MASNVIHEPSATTGMRYCDRIPESISAGLVLVHNQVYPPARRNGARGSRFWLQPPAPDLQRCDCGWHPDHWIIPLSRMGETGG